MPQNQLGLRNHYDMGVLCICETYLEPYADVTYSASFRTHCVTLFGFHHESAKFT